MTKPDRLAILVSGGPAPGINSAISAATIRAVLGGVDMCGIRDGFEWIHVPKTIDNDLDLPAHSSIRRRH